MDFVKMEGLGNDFVVLDGPLDPMPSDVAAWCDRRHGVGADGVLVVTPIDSSTVRMQYHNADGSPAEMCGNGLRCVARHAIDTGMVTGPTLTVETGVGRRAAEVLDHGAVRVELGPVATDGESIELAGHRLFPADAGNPHAVAFVDDSDAAPVLEVGPLVERDPLFPNRTNVEFATVVDRHRIRLRVWERGVGETLACGSGAAATVAAAVQQGLVEDRVMVALPGGSLEVELVDGTAWLTGPAKAVFRGAL